MSNEPLPHAIVANGVASSTNAPSPKYKRKISNFLIDRKLQLRYVVVVLLISALIASVLGYLIYQQAQKASANLDAGLANMGLSEITQSLSAQDSDLIYKMIAVGVGLAAILALFLVIMTHKVAGPLFKVSMYFDRMAVGRLSVVTPLRDGDMLRDFFDTFKHMHDAVRERQSSDVGQMASAVESLRGQPGLEAACSTFEQHVAERQKLLN